MVNVTTSGRPSARRIWSLAVLAVAAAPGLAACAGSATAPHVASLGKTSSATSVARRAAAAAKPTGSPAQVLDEWAACMRRHGDPNQADPTIGANKTIDITMSPAIRGGYYGYTGEYGNGGPGVYCRAYLNAAQTALQGGQPQPKISLATLLKFARCMRAHGISDFPDPTSKGMVLNVGGDLNPKNPAFHRASGACAKETGVPGLGGGPPPPGTIEENGQR